MRPSRHTQDSDRGVVASPGPGKLEFVIAPGPGPGPDLPLRPFSAYSCHHCDAVTKFK